jgi:hypothetical protein
LARDQAPLGSLGLNVESLNTIAVPGGFNMQSLETTAISNGFNLERLKAIAFRNGFNVESLNTIAFPDGFNTQCWRQSRCEIGPEERARTATHFEVANPARRRD